MATPIISIRMDPRLRDQGWELANRHGKSLSELLRELLLEALSIDKERNGNGSH